MTFVIIPDGAKIGARKFRCLYLLAFCFIVMLMLALVPTLFFSDLQRSFDKVEYLKLTKCNPQRTYPLELFNVDLQIDSSFNVDFSGTMRTHVDLTTPIQSSVTLYKSFYNAYFYVPCRNVSGMPIGSCSFEDLCSFGTDECPSVFIRNNIPCQCPIPKGTYTIPKSYSIEANNQTQPWNILGNFLTGYYKGNVKVHDPLRNMELTCYNFYFELDVDGRRMPLDPIIEQ